MEIQNMDLLHGVAGLYGVDGETVKAGIREAVKEARRSEDTFANAFWSALPEDATELDVVLSIARLLRAG